MTKDATIIFTNHAKIKLEILNKHGVNLTEEGIEEAVKNPNSVADGKNNRMIAQKVMDNEYVLRVIYEKDEDNIRIVTFYPARMYRYESKI